MSGFRILAALALALVPAAAFAQASASPYTSGTRYDLAGRVTGTISADPDTVGSGNPFIAVRNTYDAAGLLTKVETGDLAAWQSEAVAPASWSGFTAHHTLETTYDAMSRKTRDSVREGAAGAIRTLTQFSYDNMGRLECTAVRMNESQFGGTLPDACTQAGGTIPDRISRNVYADDRRVQLREGVGTADEGTEATWTYSPNGKVTTVVDGNGNRAELTYDGLDRQTRWTFPSTTRATSFNDATPTTALASAGSVNAADYEEYSYDPNSNRTSLRKRDGSTLTYGYDALNRVTVKTVPERLTGSQALTSAQTRDVYYAYDLRNLQLSARFDSQSGEGVTNVYDGFGRLASTSTNMGGTTRTLGYAYDANGNRTRITHPDGQAFTYRYDGLNRLTGIFVGPDLSVWLDGFAYDAQGLPTLRGEADGSNVYYSHDPIGRPTSILDTFYGGTGTASTGFSYNPAGQIAGTTRDNDAYAWAGHYAVNRPYTTNGLNQYSAAGGATFTYDPNGNLVSDGANSYVYDTENRLVSASGAYNAGLAYDPLGRLWQVTDTATGAATQFLYDGDALIGEYNSVGGMTQRYVHGSDAGADDPLIWYSTGSIAGTVHWLHADRQGSIVAITSIANGIIGTINTYDEYGVPGAANQGRFQYTGQAWLAELGMYYYKARIYSPTLGRFMQTDPIGYADQFNLYEYVGDDPVNHTDPSGRYVCGGNKEQCTAAERAINDTRVASRNPNLSANERRTLSQVSSFYGAAGRINGTVVIFATPRQITDATGDPNAAATTIRVPQAGLTAVVLPNNFSTLYNNFRNSPVAVGRDLSHFSERAERAGMVAHEGKHGSDMRNGIPVREGPAYGAGRAVERSMGAIPLRDIPVEGDR